MIYRVTVSVKVEAADKSEAFYRATSLLRLGAGVIGENVETVVEPYGEAEGAHDENDTAGGL